MPRRTVWVPDDLDERVKEEGERGESYSSFVQDSMRAGLVLEEVADGHGAELDEEWVRAAAEKYLAENGLNDSPPKTEP